MVSAPDSSPSALPPPTTATPKHRCTIEGARYQRRIGDIHVSRYVQLPPARCAGCGQLPVADSVAAHWVLPHGHRDRVLRHKSMPKEVAVSTPGSLRASPVGHIMRGRMAAGQSSIHSQLIWDSALSSCLPI